MSNATCSFFIYYYLYYSYINSIYYSYIYRIFCSYTIANSSSNITPSKKSIYSPLFWRGAGGEAVGVRCWGEAVFFYTLIFTVFSFLSSVATFIIYSPVATCFCHDVALMPEAEVRSLPSMV